MLPFSEWLHLAEALPEGGRARHDHTCGPGKTLLVSHSEDGYSARCFRCNLGGVKEHGQRRLSDINFRLLKEADDALQQGAALALPPDFTLDIPPDKAVWLYSAGLFAATCRAAGFGYSESTGRIILPVYEAGELVYLQARAVEAWRKPKYLNIRAARKGAVMWKGVHSYEEVLVTEDILSALRLTLLGHNACSTLGTAVSDGQAGYLSRFNRVIFWYDGDRAGWNGASKGMRTLGLATEVRRITTSKDPKKYSNREITEIITKERARWMTRT